MPALPCSICGRLTPERHQEEHHLIPRAKGGTETILVCRNCGDQVHRLFTLEELAAHYYTVERLRAHEGVQRWVRWVRRQPGFEFAMKTKKKRRG
ncbi:MAG: HNH endonuclease [Verrucomicrobiota bacterium JB022]|nr:HNH endonuclease [Verrucomicrobiota bacterium JB022]